MIGWPVRWLCSAACDSAGARWAHIRLLSMVGGLWENHGEPSTDWFYMIFIDFYRFFSFRKKSTFLRHNTSANKTRYIPRLQLHWGVSIGARHRRTGQIVGQPGGGGMAAKQQTSKMLSDSGPKKMAKQTKNIQKHIPRPFYTVHVFSLFVVEIPSGIQVDSPLQRSQSRSATGFFQGIIRRNSKPPVNHWLMGFNANEKNRILYDILTSPKGWKITHIPSH